MAKLKKIITKVNRVLETSKHNHDESMELLRVMEKEMNIIQATLVVFITLTLAATIVAAAIFC